MCLVVWPKSSQQALNSCAGHWPASSFPPRAVFSLKHKRTQHKHTGVYFLCAHRNRCPQLLTPKSCLNLYGGHSCPAVLRMPPPPCPKPTSLPPNSPPPTSLASHFILLGFTPFLRSHWLFSETQCYFAQRCYCSF